MKRYPSILVKFVSGTSTKPQRLKVIYGGESKTYSYYKFSIANDIWQIGEYETVRTYAAIEFLKDNEFLYWGDPTGYTWLDDNSMLVLF